MVLDQNPGKGWSEVHYLVFDAPDLSGVFEQRMKQTRILLKTMNLDHFRWVEQKRCNSEKELLNFLNRIEAKGAQGLMLRKPSSQYKPGRSTNLLKVKSFQENVGTMIQLLPGKGRNQGRMGSLLIEMDNGIRFRLGGGSRMLKGKILLPREPESFSNIMDIQKQINREWLPISGLIWRFDKDMRHRVPSVDINSRINQSDQNHWW